MQMDLSVPWIMKVKDVARLLRVTEMTVRQRVKRDTIQVRPRKRGKGIEMEWSSIDWHKWFYGTKK